MQSGWTLLTPKMRLTLRAIWFAPGDDTLAGNGRRHGSAPPADEAGDLLRGDCLRLFEPEGFRHPSPVCRIRARAIVNVSLLNVRPSVSHRPRRVLEQQLLLRRRHFSKPVAGLLPMVVVDAMVPMPRIAIDRHRRLCEIGLVVPKPDAVGVEGKRVAQV